MRLSVSYWGWEAHPPGQRGTVPRGRVLRSSAAWVRWHAQRALREILRQRDLGAEITSKSVSLDKYLDDWLETGTRPRVRERTLQDYRSILRLYVRPHLGGKRLDRLTPLEVQRMVTALREQGLSPRTIRYAHAVLSGALRQAVRWRMIVVNPASAVDLPRQRKREMHCLDAEQADRFRAAIEGTPHEALFLTLLGTGMRPSEALGLKWPDLDLEAGRVTIRRTLAPARRQGEVRFEEPKTRKPRRVPLPPSLVRALARHRKQQAQARLRLADAYEDFGLVFATQLGRPLDLRNVVNRDFKPALKRAKLPKALRLYDLRHSHATLALAAGVHVKAVAERLGHASTQLTLDVYAHVLPSMQEDATERLEAALFRS